MNTLRGLVRPAIAIGGFIILAAMAFFLVIKFGDSDMMKYLTGVFAGAVTSSIAWYFLSRNQKPTDIK